MATDDLPAIEEAVRALSGAADDLCEAAQQAVAGAPSHAIAAAALLLANGSGGTSGGNSASSSSSSAAIFGRALQLLGRALLGIGNEANAIADIGGRQYTSKNVVGDKLAKTWSDDLLKMSGEQYRLSANSYAESLRHVGNSGRPPFVADAARNTLAAARETLKAAKSGGTNSGNGSNAAIIEIAEKAVALAQVAVDVVERAGKHGESGAAAASAALQAAGKGLIVVGNAVNSRRHAQQIVQEDEAR